MGLDDRALIPISEALPMLRAERYAKVREWDEARMQLQDGFEAADGEYLIKIRNALKTEHGAWTAYLRARGLAERTARERIQKTEGRFIASPKAAVTAAFPEQERDHRQLQPAGDDDWPPPEPDATDGIWHEEVEVFEVPQKVPTITRDPASWSVEAWNALSVERRQEIITLRREQGTANLNPQETDNIEWAKWSWNPVTGCLHNCPYCYARDIANRFYVEKFVPTFRPERLGAPLRQRVPAQAEQELGYRNIFTCSMADLFGKWVPAEWIEAVLDVVREAPHWNFLFLTKFPLRLSEFDFPQNAWLGTTVDCQARVKFAEKSFAKVRGGVKWLSVEPLLEPLHFESLEMFDWVVIGGASSSSQTPEWHPPRRWVDDLEAAARAAGCMVYEKTNLQARLREYPGWERQEATLPPALAYLPSIG